MPRLSNIEPLNYLTVKFVQCTYIVQILVFTVYNLYVPCRYTLDK